MPRSTTRRSPTTTSRATPDMRRSARMRASCSGPMPVQSPGVTAMMGSLFVIMSSSLADGEVEKRVGNGLAARLGAGAAAEIAGAQAGLGEHRLDRGHDGRPRSEEHTSELQSLMRNSYAGFCLKKQN